VSLAVDRGSGEASDLYKLSGISKDLWYLARSGIITEKKSN